MPDEDDHGGGHGHVDDDQLEAEAAELGQVAEQEPRAEQHDPDLQPELVGGDPRPEDRGHPHGVADDQTEHDRPQDVLDVGQPRAGRGRDRTQARLGEGADDADGQEQQQAGQVAQGGGGPGAGGGGRAHLTRNGIDGSRPTSGQQDEDGRDDHGDPVGAEARTAVRRDAAAVDPPPPDQVQVRHAARSHPVIASTRAHVVGEEGQRRGPLDARRPRRPAADVGTDVVPGHARHLALGDAEEAADPVQRGGGVVAQLAVAQQQDLLAREQAVEVVELLAVAALRRRSARSAPNPRPPGPPRGRARSGSRPRVPDPPRAGAPSWSAPARPGPAAPRRAGRTGASRGCAAGRRCRRGRRRSTRRRAPRRAPSRRGPRSRRGATRARPRWRRRPDHPGGRRRGVGGEEVLGLLRIRQAQRRDGGPAPRAAPTCRTSARRAAGSPEGGRHRHRAAAERCATVRTGGSNSSVRRSWAPSARAAS